MGEVGHGWCSEGRERQTQGHAKAQAQGTPVRGNLLTFASSCSKIWKYLSILSTVDYSDEEEG